MFALAAYLALMTWAVCRLSAGLSDLRWQDRTHDVRLALYCERKS